MASISQTAAVRPAKSLTSRGGLVDKYFYLAMGLLAAAVVVAGFSQTVEASLFHPPFRGRRSLVPWRGVFGVGAVLHFSIGAGADTQCKTAPLSGLVWRGSGRGDGAAGNYDGRS